MTDYYDDTEFIAHILSEIATYAVRNSMEPYETIQIMAQNMLSMLKFTTFNNWHDDTRCENEIQCKECKHWQHDVAGCTDFVGRCELANWMVGENGFCVYGEMENGT